MPGMYFDTLERIDIGPRVREEGLRYGHSAAGAQVGEEV